ncbi:hypothetical protein ENBRE01_1427 [Enteropsectra breve]|nr:hypothetical protein ENBRE01_1427 [Enteropsectra breve]
MQFSKKNFLGICGLVSLVPVSDDSIPHIANPATSRESQICRAVGATANFLLASKSFKSLLEEESNIQHLALLGKMQKAMNLMRNNEESHSDSLQECYLSIYNEMVAYGFRLSTLPITLSTFIDCELLEKHIFKLTCNVTYTKASNGENAAKEDLQFYWVQCPSDFQNPEGCSIDMLINKTPRSLKEYQLESKRRFGKLSGECEFETEVVLSKCVVFDGGWMHTPEQICPIFTDSFIFRQNDQSGEKIDLKYILKSIIYSAKDDTDNPTISWEVKAFEDAESIASEMKKLFCDDNKCLRYLLYEREE